MADRAPTPETPVAAPRTSGAGAPRPRFASLARVARAAVGLALLLGAPATAWCQRPPESSAQVWKVGSRRWTAAEETRYARWVDENITDDFFVRHDIPTDCADVPYAVRWIYARIAHLPAAATTYDRRFIGHWSTDWADLPTASEWSHDRRFRAALLFMMSRTTTRTLPADTYPVRIDRTSVTPGTVFFVSQSHSGVIGHVSLDGSHSNPLQTWESTLPVKVRRLKLRDFFCLRPDPSSGSGIVRFRWPVLRDGRWVYLPAAEHPYYSQEQYAPEFYTGYADYVDAVARRIDPTQYDPWQRVIKVMETVTHLLKERAAIVLDGYARCHRGGCREGTYGWEVYGTPNRDETITFLMNYITQIVKSAGLDEAKVEEAMVRTTIEIGKGRSIDFLQVYVNRLWLSPDPADPIDARWGLDKCRTIEKRTKSIRASIDFIEKTYRVKDPAYADQASGLQRDALRALEDERVKSGCPTGPAKRRGAPAAP